ncbi:MAG: thioesterase family protein [Polyangiales bacterium]
MQPKPHVVIELPVQWGDMDALGHVNNTRYFTWFESARIALFEKIGVSSAGPSSVAPILATTTCTYLAPLHYPARLQVSARCAKVGETSLTMEYEVACGDRVHARGSSVAVLVDYNTSAKVRVPDAVRAAIAALDAE